MNEEKVERDVIIETRDSLGKIIKKPELTVKLLEKPPFRFIYDIVMAVIQQTGFMKKIFTGPDLKPDNFKTKESKIGFLNKLINAIGILISFNFQSQIIILISIRVGARHETRR